MNRRVIRLISALVSLVMVFSAIPGVSAAGLFECDDTEKLWSAENENDTILNSAPQIGGHLLNLNFEDAEIGSDAGIVSSDPAVNFEVIDGDTVDYTSKVLKLGKVTDSDLGTKINIGSFKWNKGLGERVVLTSFMIASGFKATSEEASFALAGGGSAKNISGGIKFNKGKLYLNNGNGSVEPKEVEASPRIMYGANEWYKVNMVSYVNANDEITKTEYYIDNQKNGIECVPKDTEITAKQPDRFRVNCDKTNPQTEFYIDNLTIIDFKQEMNYIEDMVENGSMNIPTAILGADTTVTLPKTFMGAEVTWTSNDTDIIDPSTADADGKVTVNHPEEAKNVELTAKLTYKGDAYYQVDGVQIQSADHKFTVSVDRSGPISDETKIKYVIGQVTAPEQATEDFQLQNEVKDEEKGITGTVTWASDNDAVRINGTTAVVTRPGYSESNVSVKLTATVTVGTASDTKEFIVNVLKNDVPVTDEEKTGYVENELLALNFSQSAEKVVSGNPGDTITLPKTITDGNDNKVADIVWTSENLEYVDNDGVIKNVPSTGSKKIYLNAAVTINGTTHTYRYAVILRSAAVVKAFPGAQGYGTQTRGGAGGYVCHVTTLSPDGPGSLKEALESKKGSRIIVFDVGGTIDLTSVGRALRMSGDDDSNVTIAGQTAPGDGIQLKGYGLTISNVHDVIIRHLSIRIGNVRKAGDTYQSDPFSATGANKRVVIDHISMCWAVDMGFRVYGNEMTMSNCMVSKGLYWNTPHEKGKHNYAGIFGAKYGTFYGNYIADCGQRAPRICDNEFIDVRNNVVSNSKYTFDICNYEWMGANTKYNVVGNIVLKGNPAPGGSTSNVTKGGSYKYFQGRTYSGGIFAYSANNYDLTQGARDLDGSDMINGAIWTGEIDNDGKSKLQKEMYVYNGSGYSNIKSPWFDMILPDDISMKEYDDSAVSKLGNTLVNYPFVVPPMQTYSAEDAAKYVLTNAGAKAPVRGILDNRYLAEGRTRLQILSDYSKASQSYGIKIDKDYEGETAYGLNVETHTVYEDENGITVYDVDGKTVEDGSNMTVKERYKFVSCDNSLDTLYAIDKNGKNKYRLVLRDYADGDGIYDAFDLYDIDNNVLTKPSPYASNSDKTDALYFNGGKIGLKYADWGDGAGNYDHKNTSVTDGNIDTSITDTEWTHDDWPQLPTVYRDGKFDTNGDGIPDFYIKLMGWDNNPEYFPNKDISRLDFEGRGYTNLEYYINDYCAGDMEIADSTENDAVAAENVRDGSAKYNTHRSHEVLFNTVRRAKAKLYWCEGEVFDINKAVEMNLNTTYDYSDSAYSDPKDFETYFSALIDNDQKGLKPNTTYSYKIKTYSDTGVEYMTPDTYTFTTLSQSEGKPGAPRVLKYIPFDGQITVVFEPASRNKSYKQEKFSHESDRALTEVGTNDYDRKTDHYILRYSTDKNMVGAREVTIPSTYTRYSLTGLVNNEEYYLDIRAVSADGTESDCATVNLKKAEASGEKDKDGNDIYEVKKTSATGGVVTEYYDEYENVLNTIPIKPTKYVVNEKYEKTLKESNIGEGETTKFISVYGDEKDWYIYTLGGIPIPTSYEGSDPMLMLRDESHDHGFTYAKKFDTLLTGKSTIHARLMIHDEELDPMNQSPELRFYVQQDSADAEDTDSDVDTNLNNTATSFGNIVSLQFTKNEILYNGTNSLARYSDDTWYDIKFLMDGDAGTCSLYINDSLIAKDLDYSESATSNSIARWQISSRLAGTEDVYVQYMYAYTGWDEPVEDLDATPKPDATVEEGTSGKKPTAGGGGGGGGGSASPKTTATPDPEATDTPDNGENTDNNTKDNKPDSGPAEDNDEFAFADMVGYDWARDAVNSLHKRGIVSGITENLFAPEREITRAEFITILMRGFDLIGDSAVCNFDDVPDGSWYYPAVAMAYSMGIVSGYSDKLFGAQDKVTRQDMAVMIYRLLTTLGLEAPEVRDYEQFTDNDQISSYAENAVKTLYCGGIINGVGDGRFEPQGAATRAAAAQMIYKTLELQVNE